MGWDWSPVKSSLCLFFCKLLCKKIKSNKKKDSNKGFLNSDAFSTFAFVFQKVPGSVQTACESHGQRDKFFPIYLKPFQPSWQIETEGRVIKRWELIARTRHSSPSASKWKFKWGVSWRKRKHSWILKSVKLVWKFRKARRALSTLFLTPHWFSVTMVSWD